MKNVTRLVAIAALAGLLSCSGKNSASKAEAQTSQPASPLPDRGDFPPDTAAPDHIDSARAMRYVREAVAFGSRPIGSEAHRKLEAYIHERLKGMQVEDDRFTAKTVVGEFPVNNIIAKYPGKKDGIVVIAGHYDTNLPLPKSYVGANDGGSSTALLLEFADYYRAHPPKGYSVWLVWTDGEEAVKQWSDTDSLYGTRHLAEKWKADGTIKKLKGLLLVDMVGDADLNIEHDANSTPWLEDLVYEAAKRLGYQSHFFARDLAIEDDHLPFARLGVPVADLIDLDYGYNNVFHHTPEDTLDKLSPKSLQIVGDVVLQTVRMLNSR